MAQGFSGYPETQWGENYRDMTLLSDFSYTDKSGKLWLVPAGSHLNGATIPRALWAHVGSPYVGKYRRASVVHDYFVGEGDNPDVSKRKRKKADRMFYEACKFDDCSEAFARILYVGVCLGTWAGGRKKGRRKQRGDEDYQILAEDLIIQAKFVEAMEDLEADLEIIGMDELERRVMDLAVV